MSKLGVPKCLSKAQQYCLQLETISAGRTLHASLVYPQVHCVQCFQYALRYIVFNVSSIPSGTLCSMFPVCPQVTLCSMFPVYPQVHCVQCFQYALRYIVFNVSSMPSGYIVFNVSSIPSGYIVFNVSSIPSGTLCSMFPVCPQVTLCSVFPVIIIYLSTPIIS